MPTNTSLLSGKPSPPDHNSTRRTLRRSHTFPMYLTELPRHHHNPFPSKSSNSAAAALIRSFDESLRNRLLSLLPPDTSLPLSYLSRAVQAARSTHTDAASFLSDPSSSSDAAAASAYLESTVRLLDACNASSAGIDCLQRRRLLALLAARLLVTGPPASPDKVRKSRKAIDEWESAAKDGIGTAAASDLIRSLAPRAPLASSSALWRAVYAAEAVSTLVVGLLIASLAEAPVLAIGARVPDEFPWADAYNELRGAALGGVAGRRTPVEIDAVKAQVKELAEAIDGERTESLKEAAAALEGATERLTAGLDQLGDAVSGLFRAAMGGRNAARGGFLVGPRKCRDL